MCGIFGVISFNGNKIDKEKVLAARDVLAHRGPDDAGIYLSSDQNRSLANARDDSSIPPCVALAHRRLSIIDLSSAAHQPMTTPDGRYVIVFNGEIYNYRSLIPNLSPKEKGIFKSNHYSNENEHLHPNSAPKEKENQIPSPSTKEKGVFKSNSDTEVILYLYEKYGKDCLQFLRGMFAFAIWDDKEKKLFAARDRFGIKPFYYFNDDAGFIFSSEIKAIKHYKGSLTINNDALDAFLRTGSVPAPLTVYKEVKALMPGNYLELFIEPSHFDAAQCDMLKVTINKYWGFGDLFGRKVVGDGQGANVISTNEVRRNPDTDEISKPALSAKRSTDDPVPSPEGMNMPEMSTFGKLRMTEDKNQETSIGYHFYKLKYDDEAKKIIREALLDTIRAHMVSDVEVGAFLSGGIDSTAIVSLMRQVGKEKIKTVSIVFPDSRFDESKYSRLAAKYYKTEHIEIPFYEKDLLDDFEKIMTAMDQPTIDGINTYFVSKAAKQAGLKVVLSGLGGDELFGGYPSFNLIPKLWKIKKIPFAKMFMKVAVPLLKYKLPAKAIEYLLHPDAENAEYKLIRGLFTDDELSKLGWLCHPELVEGSSSDISTNEVRRNLNNNKISQPALSADRSLDKSGSFEMTTMQHISFLESCFYMRNQLLRDSDVFSMAHSIELRVPFVDHLFYAAVLPYLDNAYDKKFPKKMLVEAVGDIPGEIIHRPKMGFTFPFEDWIKQGKLKNDIVNSINKSDIKLNILNSTLNIDRLHWSRKWALFILSKFTI
ncbi:asparagine synthetase B [Ignavibacterium sp.]|uniref:asparagine synthetase B family protein n=1 Tax=Ignavibacterium sp. TaxID=2651167 RepID=UPI00307F32A6